MLYHHVRSTPGLGSRHLSDIWEQRSVSLSVSGQSLRKSTLALVNSYLRYAEQCQGLTMNGCHAVLQRWSTAPTIM